MTAAAQTAAKQFFADRVIRQAEVDGVTLSEAERHMLFWSESDPNFAPQYQLASALETEMSVEEYEAKIARLLFSAFAADYPSRAAGWHQQRAVLEEGDHYILIMLAQALGEPGRPRRWWQFW